MPTGFPFNPNSDTSPSLLELYLLGYPISWDPARLKAPAKYDLVAFLQTTPSSYRLNVGMVEAVEIRFRTSFLTKTEESFTVYVIRDYARDVVHQRTPAGVIFTHYIDCWVPADASMLEVVQGLYRKSNLELPACDVSGTPS